MKGQSMTEIVMENHGVLHGRKFSDYLAGSTSPLGYEVNMTDGKWNQYVPTGENQNVFGVPGTDKMECVTQSYNNSVETQINWMKETGRLPAPHLAFLNEYGYIDVNGKVNFNERISATLNETMTNGNWLFKVADKAMEYGLFPMGMLDDNKRLPWNEYYNKALITPEMLAVGKKFLEFFQLTYEWIGVSEADLKYHLKHAPIQVVFPNHAVEQINHPGQVEYFDSYSPYIKRKATRQFTSAMKIVVTPQKNISKTRWLKVLQGTKAGLLVLEGQCGTILFEDSFSDYTAWLKLVPVPTDAPTVIIPLGKYFKINDNGKVGLAVIEGYTGTVLFEDKMSELTTLLEISGAAPDVPTVNIPLA